MQTIIKTITITLLSAIFLFSNTSSAQDKKVVKDAEVKYSVELTCMNCVKKLESQLPFEEGVVDLKVDLATKTVWFKYKVEKTNKEKLSKALDNLGYPGKEIEIKK